MASIVRFLLALSSGLIACAVTAQTLEDPPERVGRLVVDSGSVMLHNADYPEWVEAQHNWPLTTGDTLHGGRDTRAEIRMGSSVVRMDADTEMRIERLDDERIIIRLDAGSLAVRVRGSDPEDAIVVETPDGSAIAAEPGSFLIERVAMTTTVTANSGRLTFHAPDRQFSVVAGQRAEIWNAGHTEVRVGAPQRTAFSNWVMARESREDGLPVPAGVSRELIGVEDLSAHGYWTHYPQHGTVWYPHSVPGDWAPYRSGRWIRVSPWGWTWLDEMSWGFAPFHYGRWSHINGRWGWIPGAYVARPAYAPALVAWVGSPGWSVGFSFGPAAAIGWFPLGPHEVFVPAYRSSPRYIRKINIVHVTNETHIARAIRSPHDARHKHRARPGAVTIVPSNVVARGRPVRHEAVRDPGRWLNDRLDIASAPRLSPERSDRRPHPATARQRAPHENVRPRETATRTRDHPQPRTFADRRPTDGHRADTMRPPRSASERQSHRQPAASTFERRDHQASRRFDASQPARVSTPTQSIDDSRREIRESAVRSRTATNPPRTSDPARSVRGAGHDGLRSDATRESRRDERGRHSRRDAGRTTTPRADVRSGGRSGMTERRSGPPGGGWRNTGPRHGGSGDAWGSTNVRGR